MNINVSSSIIKDNATQYTTPSILIMGKGKSDIYSNEIIKIKNEDDVIAKYGDCDLLNAYQTLKEFDVNNVYMVNCYTKTDFFKSLDKMTHYSFDYIIPIGIYLSDKYFNPSTSSYEYYAEYFLNKLKATLSTVIFTERHSLLYKDFDEYVLAMKNIQVQFFRDMEVRKAELLKVAGNNLNFVLSNVNDVAFSNVLLGALYTTRDTTEYFKPINSRTTLYHLDKIDVGDRTIYFKHNYYGNFITVENAYNFKLKKDAQANVLIDDAIKKTTKALDLSDFKGKIYNPHIALQIESKTDKILRAIKGKIIKSYTVNKVVFKKDSSTSGHIILDVSVTPYGTLEKINIIRGVN